ncbi:hypothetical protein [Prosthecochloris sp.]|uniref:LPD3 domain-containing protein n=1 Tax=Prosthecochloris sp. TaxID=290513 RepID=UPI00257C5A7D|nr:hypothetical protein [Prosthecochloris sp.]
MNAFEQAADVQPDKYAQQKELGEAAGIDLEQLPGFEPEARRNKLFMDAGLNRLWEGAPVTAKWLSNPDNAKLASDSVQQLSGIESVFKRISEIPQNIGEQWQEGQLMAEQGFIGQRMQSGTSTMEDVRRIEEINERMAGLRGEKTIEGAVTQVLGQMSTTLPEALRFGGESAIVAGTVATVAGQAGPQVAAPEELITVPGAALTAFFAGTTWKMADQAYKIEAGHSYLEMINEGIDKDTAALASAGVGLVNAALELTGVGIVTAPIRKALTKKVASGLAKAMTKPTKKQAFLNFGKAYLKAWSGETSTEFLQEVSSVAGVELAKVLEGRESLLETEEGRAEIAGRLVDIVEQVGKGMSVLAFPGAAVQFNMDYSRAKAAQRQTEFFNELNDAVAENPLKKRSPAAFEEFLRAQTNGTPVENVFIDVDQFAQVLVQQGVAREALQQNIPEVAKQVDEAVAIGGDITIPTAKYAVHFAGTDLGNAMQPHLKISPEKMSQAEAQQFEQEKTRMMAESQEVIEQKQETDQTFRESANEVKQTVFEQIKATGQYMQDEARTMSTLAQAFYVTKAAEMGIQPKELYDRIPYRVVSGEMQTEGQVLQQQGKDAPIFYSQLEKVIREAKHLKMPGKQWSQWLKSNAPKLGVKADEMQAVGIEEFLELKGNDKVTRQEIEEYLRQNGVRVEEVIKGSKDERYALGSARLKFVMEQNPIQVQELKEVGLEPFIDTDSGIDGVLFKDVEYGDFYDYEEVQSMSEFSIDVGQVAQMIAEEYVEGATETIPFPTKYSMYTLPGGDEYRELLLTLPESRNEDLGIDTSGWTVRVMYDNVITGQRELEVLDASGDVVTQHYGYRGSDEDAVYDAAKKRAEIMHSSSKRKNQYKSSHWGEPNVLAHIRFNDRTGADGKKVLFIEEIQSDWGQEGKKRGFAQDVNDVKERQNKLEAELVEKYGEAWRLKSTPQENAQWDEYSDMIRGAEEGVQSAPFVTDTKAWVGLAIKRMIRYATEGGYDKVAFINGEQSAERYDLSKQVKSIEWNGYDSRGAVKLVSIDPIDGNTIELPLDSNGKVINAAGTQFDGKPIDEVVGKEIAEKIMTDRSGELSGDGLKIGGEGMKAFYDKIVPSVANKIVKKYGAKVEGNILGGKLEGLIDYNKLFGELQEMNELSGAYDSQDFDMAVDMMTSFITNYSFVKDKTLRQFLRAMTSSTKEPYASVIGSIEPTLDDPTSTWQEKLDEPVRKQPKTESEYWDDVSEVQNKIIYEYKNSYVEKSSEGLPVSVKEFEKYVNTIPEKMRGFNSSLVNVLNWDLEHHKENKASAEVAKELLHNIAGFDLTDQEATTGESTDKYFKSPGDIKREIIAFKEIEYATFEVTDKMRETAMQGQVLFQSSGLRKAKTFTEAKTAAQEFVGKPLVNRETGMVVTVSKNSVSKMLSRKAVGKSETPALHSAAVANADRLFEHAIHGWSKPDEKGSASIAAIHRFFAPFNTGDGVRMVKLTVKESARSDQSNRLYTLEAVELNEKAPAALWVDATIKADGFDPTSILSVEAIYKLANAVENNKFLQAGSGSRGGFDPQQLTTILTKKADLSTYLHETSHFYLEALSRIATMPEATAQDKADMQTVLDWFGVKDLDAWSALSLDEQRKHHEAFAYNFELYMFEGKAPSLKLQQVFDRFRKWLLRVYRSIREELNDAYKQENGTDLPILTGEIREVMDRMLASEEDIRLAEQVQSMKPLFDERALTQMTAEQVEEYQAAQQEAHDNAVSDLSKASLRQMKWLSNARSRILKDLQKKANAERKQIRYEVTAEVLREPVYKAMTELKKGDGGLKIKLSDAQELAGENWRKLGTGRFGMIRRDGQPVDFVAEIFGFDSGDAMVKALLDARPMKEVIAEKTDLRMENEFSELVDPKQKEEAVQKSLHNEARARFIAVELRALANARSPVRVLTAAAKQTAKTLVEQRQVKDLRPHVHTVAEAKAARQAEAEMKKGLTMEAAQSKRRQLLQNHMASESIAAKEFVEKARKYFKRLQSDVSRKRMGADAGDQIDALLERFGLKSLGSYVERQSLAEWLNVQEDIGRLPEIAQSLQNESYRRDYRELSFAEFVDLHDAIRQIEHIGRNERKLLSAAKEIEYEKARDEIVTSINANARGRKAETRAPTTSFGRFKKGYERFKASHLKASAIARILDGGKDGGPVWEYLIRPANEAGNKEVEMRADATIRLSDIIVPVLKAGKMGGKGKMFPSINRSLNREQVFAIALNTGNASNIQRLTSGEGWTMEQVMPVLESLTEAELQAVQEVWDFFESYRPQIAEKERRVFGREPKWIEPQTITIKSADGKDVGLRGGYYPVVYDPAASQRAEAYADAEQAKLDMKGAFTSATTRRSFTKTRTERVVGRPLLYNLAGMYNGANEVIHDLSWHEFLIDANRLLRSHGIDEAIRTQYGPEWKSQLKQWVKDVAVGERLAMRSGEEIIGKIRQNISAAGLGFNAVSAAIQLLGFNQSVVRVGAKWIAKGVSQATANPLQTIKDVRSKSEFMADRGRTQFRELNEIRNMVQGESLAKKRVKMGTFLFIVKMQQLVDVPTWIGAYEKALFEGNGEKRAIALADQAVIDSQASGMIKDLSAIERGGPAMKLFTVFYTYMNTVFNMATVSKMTARSKGKLVVDMLMIFVVPVVFDRIIRDAVTPDTDEDEWDWSKVARRFAADELEYLMGTMFLVRELTYISETLTGAEGPRFGYSGPAGLRLLDDIGTFATQASQLEFDRAFVRSAINLIGSGTGLPSAQINRTIKGAEALLEEETKNPAALIFGTEEK